LIEAPDAAKLGSIKGKNIIVIAICPFVFAVIFCLLAFGIAVVCYAPDHPGESPWQLEKSFQGLLPICASIGCFAITLRLWARAFARRRNAWLAGCVVLVLAWATST